MVINARQTVPRAAAGHAASLRRRNVGDVNSPSRQGAGHSIFAIEEFGCRFARNRVMVRPVSLPFAFTNPITGKEVVWKNH